MCAVLFHPFQDSTHVDPSGGFFVLLKNWHLGKTIPPNTIKTILDPNARDNPFQTPSSWGDGKPSESLRKCYVKPCP